MKLQNAAWLILLGFLNGFMVPSLSHAQSLTPKMTSVDPNYNVPLRFDVLGDGVKLSPLYLDWDLSDPNHLQISGVTFDDKTFFVGIFQAANLDRRMASLFKNHEANEWMLIAKWPWGLLQSGGVIEAFTRSGKVLWRQQVKEQDLADWQTQLKQWQTRLLKERKGVMTQETLNSMSIFQTSLGFRHFKEASQPFWKLQEPFRLCLSKELESGLQTRMCSRLMETAISGKGNLSFMPVARSAEAARVIAFNEVAVLKDSKEVKVGEPVQFYAELASGASYEFISKPMRFNLVEMIQGARPQDDVKIVAWGAKPNIPVTEIKTDNLGLIEKWIGPTWYATIGDTRQFWETTVSRNSPTLHIPGDGGGLFRLDFEITKLPGEQLRPYLRSSSLDATYVDNAKFFGKIPANMANAKNTKLSSTMNSAEVLNDKAGEFMWKFGAKSKGENNRAYVLVDDGENTFRAYRDIYRGYPGEISARLTGLAGTGGNLIFMGELATSYWFESLATWSNYYLSRDRWGISANYFQSFNQVQLSSLADTLTYLNLNLKYRLTPGLWSRDETWGLELGSSQVGYNIFQTQLIGGGVFWARSMPRILDDAMNSIRWLNHPKWVDMEFIYYPSSLSSTVTPLNFGSGYGNWQLNFHGKVMLTKQLFSELGFGLKQLDLLDQVNSSLQSRVEMQFTSFYGTVGFGLSF